MVRTLTSIVLAATAFLSWLNQAEAAESYDNCKGFIESLPATISTPGTWCLNEDLYTNINSNYALAINANDVTIDCNHFKIDGLPAGRGTSARGINVTRLNTTIRNCDIRGFYIGILSIGGHGGLLIEGNRLTNNRYASIYINGDASIVRNNLVTDTGDTGAIRGPVTGIRVSGESDVINNTVNGILGGYENGNVYGIWTGRGANVIGNRVRGLAQTGTGTVRGIYNASSGYGVTRDNIVQGPGREVARGIGIYCTKNQATAQNNVIAGFETAIQGCLDRSNAINPR